MTDKERKLLIETTRAVVGVLGTMGSLPGTSSMVNDVLAALNAVEFEEIELRIQAARAARSHK